MLKTKPKPSTILRGVKARRCSGFNVSGRRNMIHKRIIAQKAAMKTNSPRQSMMVNRNCPRLGARIGEIIITDESDNQSNKLETTYRPTSPDIVISTQVFLISVAAKNT